MELGKEIEITSNVLVTCSKPLGCGVIWGLTGLEYMIAGQNHVSRRSFTVNLQCTQIETRIQAPQTDS